MENKRYYLQSFERSSYSFWKTLKNQSQSHHCIKPRKKANEKLTYFMVIRQANWLIKKNGTRWKLLVKLIVFWKIIKGTTLLYYTIIEKDWFLLLFGFEKDKKPKFCKFINFIN